MNGVSSFLRAHKTLFLSIGFLVLFAATVSYATPPASPYAAGATLDPACAPGSANCTVAAGSPSPWTVTGNDVYYTAGKVGIGTTTPSAPLSIQRAVANTPLILSTDTNGAEVFRIGSDDDSNFFAGYHAGAANTAIHSTSGTQNAFIGSQAGMSNTSGYGNSALGYKALSLNTTGIYNAATGAFALGKNTTGTFNSALGEVTLNNNDTGTRNVAVGAAALYTNTSGSFNVGVGVNALYTNTGSYNTALGYGTSQFSTSGSYNIAIGAWVHNASQGGSGQLNIGNVLYGTGIYQGPTSSFAPTADGRIGIGVVAPQYPLDVTGTSGVGINYDNTAGHALMRVNGGGAYQAGYYIYKNGSEIAQIAVTSNSNDLSFNMAGTERMRLLANGYLGIGTAPTTPTAFLTVGSASATDTILAHFENNAGSCNLNPANVGGLSCTSDMNAKKNISILSDNSPWAFSTNVSMGNQSVLSKVLALTPVRYNFKTESDADQKHTGFIAQDIEYIFPELVSTDDTGRKTLNYTGLIPYTIEAIKEMNITMKALPTFNDPTLAQNIATFLTGIAERGEAVVNKVTTKQLCLNNTCLTEDQLQNLIQLQQNMQQGNGGGSTTLTSSTPPADTAETQSPEVAGPEVEPVVPAEDQTPASSNDNSAEASAEVIQ